MSVRSARSRRYCRPAASYPPAATDAADVGRIGWRDFFREIRACISVIESGIANNRDLRIAAGNVLQARAQARIRRGRSASQSGQWRGLGATFTSNATGAGATTGTGRRRCHWLVRSGGLFTEMPASRRFEADASVPDRVRNLSRAAQKAILRCTEEGASAPARISLIHGGDPRLHG